jgi:hypothetical protein
MFLVNRADPVYAEALESAHMLGFDMNTYLDLLHDSPKSCFGLRPP